MRKLKNVDFTPKIVKMLISRERVTAKMLISLKKNKQQNIEFASTRKLKNVDFASKPVNCRFHESA